MNQQYFSHMEPLKEESRITFTPHYFTKEECSIIERHINSLIKEELRDEYDDEWRTREGVAAFIAGMPESQISELINYPENGYSAEDIVMINRLHLQYDIDIDVLKSFICINDEFVEDYLAYSSEQCDQICLGIKHGLSRESILSYCDESKDALSMQVRRERQELEELNITPHERYGATYNQTEQGVFSRLDELVKEHDQKEHDPSEIEAPSKTEDIDREDI